MHLQKVSTQIRPWSVPKLSDTLMIFMEEYLEKLNLILKKSPDDQNTLAKLSSMQIAQVLNKSRPAGRVQALDCNLLCSIFTVDVKQDHK